jgi:hypothetical protein
VKCLSGGEVQSHTAAEPRAVGGPHLRGAEALDLRQPRDVAQRRAGATLAIERLLSA